MVVSRSFYVPTAVSNEWPAESSTDDAALIGLSKAGDLQAFNMLIVRYQQRIYAVCYRMLRSEDAEDATQEVFLAAFHGIHRYRGGSLLTWLLRIATNKCIDHLRALKRRPSVSLDQAGSKAGIALFEVCDPGESPDQRMVRAELAHNLEYALQDLPADQRLAVILSDIHGYNYGEIAAATGWLAGTVKSRLSRGRARLRGALQSRDFL